MSVGASAPGEGGLGRVGSEVNVFVWAVGLPDRLETSSMSGDHEKTVSGFKCINY